MLHVQQYLNTPGKSLATLTSELAIRTTKHPTEPLVILNYDQCESPDTNPIVMECRGLTVDTDTWKVVGRSFPRFFNAGQHPEITGSFNWGSAWVQEKVDGSLITVYRYLGKTIVNTRGTFGQGEIVRGLGLTWEEVFWKTELDPEAVDDVISIHGDISLVMELCSPYNKNVRTYPEPIAYLLTIVNNASGIEWPVPVVDRVAVAIGARRPLEFGTGTAPEQLAALIEGANDPTFEGFVLRDSEHRRLKVKNPKYVALHHLKGNGESICSPKYLIPFLLSNNGEEDEVLKYLPELKAYYYALKDSIEILKDEILFLWLTHKDKESQKDFALAVKDSAGASFLFEARKSKRSIAEVWLERAEPFLQKWAPDNVRVPAAV